MRGRIEILIAVVLAGVLTGCVARTENAPSADTPMPTGGLVDAGELPEDDERDEKDGRYLAAMEWISLYNERFGENSASCEIMDAKQIAAFNQNMRERTNSLVDIINFENVSWENLKEEIEKGSFPENYYFANGLKVTETERNEILNNRNISEEHDVLNLLGIITTRADVRTVPFGEPILKTENDTYYDRIQETEIVVGTGVRILHESLCGKYYYIKSYYYSGWIDKTSVAVTDDAELWKKFCEPETYSENGFAMITEAKIELDGRQMDMGVKLPKVSKGDVTNVELPAREETGKLTTKTATINKKYISDGFLKYTMENYYYQCFKFLGTPYGWGGTDGNVDCSSFACAVFKSFGVYLPRNSGPQGSSVGVVNVMEGIGVQERETVVKEIDCPTIVWKPGHIMLFLGMKDGNSYIIHAASGGTTVNTARLDLTLAKMNFASVKTK